MFLNSFAIKALLGYRSGSKSLQAKMSSDDFKVIREKLKEEGKLLIDGFYELDNNFIKNKLYLLKDEKEWRIEVTVTFLFKILQIKYALNN